MEDLINYDFCCVEIFLSSQDTLGFRTHKRVHKCCDINHTEILKSITFTSEQTHFKQQQQHKLI